MNEINMKKEELISQLNQEIEVFKNRLSRIERDEYQLHKLDVHILLEKTRILYDKLSELEILIEQPPEKIDIPLMPFNVGALNDTPDMAEELTDQDSIAETKEDIEEEKFNPDSSHIFEPVKQQEINKSEEVSAQTAEIEILNIVPEVDVVNSDLISEPVNVGMNPENTKTLSNFDLFSATAEKTISDKLSLERQQTLADKMRQSHISDLRQAIGINEKFLFINELFKGDLGKYNKAIDELNEMKTKEGISTFFIELKIINQWSEDNAAFRKLKEIIDRKFE